MGMGLILSGIGQGVSQAGATYGGAMMEVAKSDILEQRKLALEEMREEAKAKRSILEAEKATAAAKDIASERKAAELEANAQKIASVTPSMDTEQIKKLMQENPEYVKSFQKSGLIAGEPTRNQQRIQEAEDLYAGARKIGASAKTLESIDAQRKRTLEEIRIESKEESEKAQRAQTDRRLDIMEKSADARAARGDSDKSNSQERLTTMINSANQTIRSLNDSSKGNTPESKAEWQRQMDDAIKLRNNAQSRLNRLFEENNAPAKPPKPSDNAKPTPVPAGSRPPLDSFRR